MTTLTEIAETSGVAFGTSGARGLVSNLQPAVCAAFVDAFITLIGSQSKAVLIGHDLRPSSPDFTRACIAAATECGISCIYAGALPTPAIAQAALRLGLPAIVVTGSHIPFDRNGIKFYRPTGEITKADEARMLGSMVNATAPSIALQLPPVDPRPRALYLDRYRHTFAADVLSGSRIGVYEHSSVARDLLHEVLQALGATTIRLGRTDDFVAVDTEAIRPEDMARARGWADDHHLDAIVSADGDADRPMLADETGTWLRGDSLGLLTAIAIGADTIVTPVSSNTAAEKCGAIQHVVRTRIGAPHVIEAMEQAAASSQGPVIGYEANGGVLLGSDITLNGRPLAALPTRDAILPLLTVLTDARRRGLTLSELASTLPRRFTHSDRLQDVPTAASRQLIDRLRSDPAMTKSIMAPASGNVVAGDLTDGLRVTFVNGDIVHLRPSGNAPELRCYAEAETPERARSLCHDCLQQISKIAPA